MDRDVRCGGVCAGNLSGDLLALTQEDLLGEREACHGKAVHGMSHVQQRII